eukprot:g17349.t1
MLSEQNQESKRLEVKLREETNKGDTKAAMDAAAIAAARALLEIVPFKDPSLLDAGAPDIYSDAYNGHRTDESRQREMAEAAPKKEIGTTLCTVFENTYEGVLFSGPHFWERWKEDFNLRSGDMIVINNKRAAHRWLQHAKVRVAHGSRGADQWQERIIK